MENVVFLKDWCNGQTPDKDDVLSWSNLILERSLQIKDPDTDPISKYFVEHWLNANKDKKCTLLAFERTFSGYGLHFQVALMNSLVTDEMFKPIDLIDRVKPNGLLHRHLLTLPEVWLNMEPHQFRDNIYSSFNSIIQAGKDKPDVLHPGWLGVQKLQTTEERNCLFDVVLSSCILSTFGFLRDDRSFFNIDTFHQTIETIGRCWNINPAQIMYGLLLKEDRFCERYAQYEEYIEPYANNIRELIQFSIDSKSERILKNLPISSKPIDIDMIHAFLIGSDPDNIFFNPNSFVAVPADIEDEKALTAAMSF